MLALVVETYGAQCVHCHKPGADTVEHVHPRSRCGTDAIENLRPAHRQCNSKRGTRAMPGYGAQATVVMGPPRSGKSTWVREHAGRGDIVIDLDLLGAALTVGADDSAPLPGHVRHVAIGARAEAIRRAVHLREEVHVWIVHAMPTPGQRAEYIEAGIELVTIDPGQETIMARIAPNDRAALTAAERWYAARAALI
jgi:hypothetical protein